MRADMLPIYAAVAAACWLAYRGRGGIRLRPWLPAAGVAAAVGVAVPPLLARLGHDQYNLYELLRADKPLAGLTLAMACLWAPLTAAMSSAAWRGGRRLAAAAWVPVGLLVAWGLLRRGATVESIHDILGGPTFLWPLDLEYIARFAAVYLPFAWLPLALPLAAMSSRRGLVACALASAALVAAAPAIIENYSHADNVRELFRPGGGHLFAVACLTSAWAATLFGAVRWPVALLAAAAWAAPVWWMFSEAVDVDIIHGLRLGPAMFAAAYLFYVMCAAPAAASLRRPTT